MAVLVLSENREREDAGGKTGETKEQVRNCREGMEARV